MNNVQKPANFTLELSGFKYVSENSDDNLNTEIVSVSNSSEAVKMVLNFAKLCKKNGFECQASILYLNGISVGIIMQDGQILFINKVINGKVISTKTLFR